MTDEKPRPKIDRFLDWIHESRVEAMWKLAAGAVTTLFGAFALGFGAYHGILTVAKLDVVPSDSFIRKTELKDRYIERAEVERDYVRREIVKTPVGAPTAERPVEGGTSTNSEVSNATFEFSDRVPFPKGLDDIRPGMRFSEALRLSPGGRMTNGAYQMKLSHGVLNAAVIFPTSGTESDPDPVIQHIVFVTYKDSAGISNAALQHLGSVKYNSQNLGTRVVWPRIGGFKLDVEGRALRGFIT